MKPGFLSDRITFFDLVEQEDGQGGAEVSGSDLITVWASVKPFNSNQALAYGQLTTQQGYNIETRYLKMYEITQRTGIKYKGKILTIHAVVDDDDKRLKITAFEHE